MKKIALLVYFISVHAALAQQTIIPEIEKTITMGTVRAPLTFLAADEMRGRDTGSREIDIAANYLAAEFQSFGLTSLSGAENYFQLVDLEKMYPPSVAGLTVNERSYTLNNDFVLLETASGEWTGKWVYVGYGTPQEIPSDIKGKMIVSIAGSPTSAGREPIYEASEEKLDRLLQAGAAGLIEITPSTVSWTSVMATFGKNKRTVTRKPRKNVPHIWINGSEALWTKDLQPGKRISGLLKISAKDPLNLPSKNVIGKIEGTDPHLKNEYLVISAHYDHLGVGRPDGQDSIFNGARDNALGVVTMLSAARFLSKFPPKRSVIFIAFTGEERGLLGSYWYASHPLVPMKQVIFNFNSDGAGYTDKTSATIIGLLRTSAGTSISQACASFGIHAVRDSVLDKVIFQGTDAYNFIKKGIPSICYCPGFISFSPELLKYYHQPADEVGSLDFDYLLKFCRAFVYANTLIANDPKAPAWKTGDPYEPVGKQLYGTR